MGALPSAKRTLAHLAALAVSVPECPVDTPVLPQLQRDVPLLCIAMK